MGSILLRFVVGAAVLLGAGAALGSGLGSRFAGDPPALVEPFLVPSAQGSTENRPSSQRSPGESSAEESLRRNREDFPTK